MNNARRGKLQAIPVYTHDASGGQRVSPVPRLSCWSRCVAWLRYYGTQTRWDIERGLARLLRQRWS
ncbi:MAG: hypothetical protein J2P36_05485 [Ktedonobacteraceae bacterium]|nr:hypothetical protein [Ktedonobacteraceae bacterium]